MITITLDENYTAIANFQAIVCYQIARVSNPPEGGDVDIDASTPENCPSGPGWTPGSPVILIVSENVNYEFVDWTDSDGIYTGNTNNPLIIGNGELTNDRTLTANFNFNPPCYDITVQVLPMNEGTVIFNPARGDDCTNGWIPGNVQITAVPDEPAAYEFDSWGGDAASNGTNNPGILSVDGNKSIIANFNQIAQLADLYIQKSDSIDPATIGQPFTYTLIVGNNGPDAATDVQVIDNLPLTLSPISVTSSQGTCAIGGNLVACSIGILPSAISQTIDIAVVPNVIGNITNTAVVSNNAPNEIDNNPINNSTIETTQIQDQAISGLTATNDSPTTLGLTTTLTATITAGTNVSYTWNFGDGSNGSGPTTSHTYAAPGLYTVTVTATNAVSSQVTTITVSVEENEFTIFMPAVLNKP